MRPNDLVQEYLGFWSYTFEYHGPERNPPIEYRWVEFCPITNYVMGYSDKARAARIAIRAWLRAKAKIAGSGVKPLHEDDEWTVSGLASEPLRISDKMLLYTLNGKANPDHTDLICRVVSMMIYEKAATKSLRGVNTLREFINEFVGVDCNGFVANFIKQLDPEHKHMDIESYDNGATVRDKASEIQALDILFPVSSIGHIAIIDRILERHDDKIVCTVSEARGGGAGGAQTNTWTIRKNTDGNKSYKWAMIGPGGLRGCHKVFQYKKLKPFASMY
jgi:hypothetical protein